MEFCQSAAVGTLPWINPWEHELFSRGVGEQREYRVMVKAGVSI